MKLYMYLCANFTVDNWLALITLFFAAIGGSFALFQWTKSIRIKRAEFLNQIIEKIRSDKDLITIGYVIDYNQTWYNQSFHNSELEGSIDKLFSYIDYICYLRYTKNITKTEFQILQYKIHRVCISLSSQAYLWNLYHFSKKNNSECSFQYLIDYGIESKILPKRFKTDTNLFEKTLNW